MKKIRFKNCNISTQNVRIDDDVVIGDNVIIHQNVEIIGKSKIGDDVEIFSNTLIEDSVIGNGSKIRFSVIEKSEVGENNVIGPFSHLRPNVKTDKNVKIGNYVELKNAQVGEDSKISHLAYVGDATIGKRCNVGCGVIFANYNGKIKQHTNVGDDVFIGCNSNLIAPVTIGNGVYICAGTTVTKDIEEKAFVIGRSKEEIKRNRENPYTN